MAKPPKHSRLGASKSSRWLRCKGSVGFIAANIHRIPKEKPSEYAQEGTLAHELAIELFKGGKAAKAAEASADEEMLAHVTGYVKFVQLQAQTNLNCELYVEQRAPLFYFPKEEGTADAVGLGDTVLFVGDLKYGEGVSVEAVRNPQLAIYLRSWILHKKLKVSNDLRVLLFIYQPRARDQRFVRKWETTVGELLEFCADIEATALSILKNPDAQPFHADDDTTCRWCAAKSICPHRTAMLFEETPEQVDIIRNEDPSMVPVADLTDAQLARVVKHGPMLTRWIKEVQEYAKAMHAEGRAVKDTKLVEGKGSRDWVSEEVAEDALRRYIHKQELRKSVFLSPHEIEKRLKAPGLRRPVTSRLKNRLKEIIVHTAGEPVLVHVSDKRPAITHQLSQEDLDILL